MAQRQTASYLIRRFEQAGIRPDTRKGQNFLVDLNLLQLLVDRAELQPQDVVLEVGTGLGSLTVLLAERAGAVVTVEVDRHLQQLAVEQLAAFGNVVMLSGDALKNKNRLHPDVLAAVQAELQREPGRRLKLVANLPYNIATPVLSNLLSTPVTPVSMTVTIQKEVADRMTASPGTKPYGALSIWLQSQCETELVRLLPASVFWPRPKVQSAILHIEPVARRRARIPDHAFFHQFVRALFLHRRKFLRSVLVSACKGKLGKLEVDAVLADNGIEPTVRAETLSVETVQRLCESVRQRVTASPDACH